MPHWARPCELRCDCEQGAGGVAAGGLGVAVGLVRNARCWARLSDIEVGTRQRSSDTTGGTHRRPAVASTGSVRGLRDAPVRTTGPSRTGTEGGDCHTCMGGDQSGSARMVVRRARFFAGRAHTTICRPGGSPQGLVAHGPAPCVRPGGLMAQAALYIHTHVSRTTSTIVVCPSPHPAPPARRCPLEASNVRAQGHGAHHVRCELQPAPPRQTPTAKLLRRSTGPPPAPCFSR